MSIKRCTIARHGDDGNGEQIVSRLTTDWCNISRQQGQTPWRRPLSDNTGSGSVTGVSWCIYNINKLSPVSSDDETRGLDGPESFSILLVLSLFRSTAGSGLFTQLLAIIILHKAHWIRAQIHRGAVDRPD